MPLTASDFSALLKTDYKGPIIDQLENSTYLMAKMERHEEETGGNFTYFPSRKLRTTSVGARRDGANETVPTGATPGYAAATFPLRSLYATVRITGFSMRTSRADNYAFARAQTQDMQDTVTDLKKDFNRQLFSDGSAELCYISGATASFTTTFTVASNLYPTNPTKYIFVGQKIDIAVRTTGSISLNTAIVTAVSSTTFTATTSAGTVAALDLSSTASVYRQGNIDSSGSKEIYGLYAALSSADPNDIWGTNYNLTPDYGNLARATNTWWKGQELRNPAAAGTVRPLSVNLLQQGIDAPYENGGGGQATFLQTNVAIYRVYGSLLAAARIFNAEMDLDGGWKALSVNGTPMLKDNDCPDYTVFCIDETLFMLGVSGQWSWLGEGDNSMLLRLPGQDQYEAVMVRDCNLMVRKPGANAIIRDVAHS